MCDDLDSRVEVVSKKNLKRISIAGLQADHGLGAAEISFRDVAIEDPTLSSVERPKTQGTMIRKDTPNSMITSNS